MVGAWRGRFYQPWFWPSSTTIHIRLRRRGFRGTARYPQLRCSGVLRGSQKASGSFVFSERITKGLTRCVPVDVAVVSILSRNFARWTWYLPRTGYFLASAILRRR